MEENATDSFKEVREAIYKFPLPLLSINSPTILSSIDKFLPYSHGMEFECHQMNNYDIKRFQSIPDIMAVSSDSREQRYRIPSGLKGLVCLYRICTELKLNSLIDPESSNHYHTDLSDIFGNIKSLENYNDWIIEELKTWETAKDLSNACEYKWYKFNDLGTLEVRIGEPTFDYEIIVKRLIQCSKIATKIRSLIDPVKYKLAKLQQELLELEGVKVIETPEEEMDRIINQRNVKI